MSDLRTAAQQALEAWQTATYGHPSHHKATLLAMTALRAALAQQAEPVQEPAYKVKVAGRWHDTEPLAPAFSLPDGEHLLYTAPPQRKPLPKHDQHCVDVPGYGLMAVRLVRAVERAHGIKE